MSAAALRSMRAIGPALRERAALLIFERLSRAGARFVAANEGIDTDQPGSELTLDIMAAIARQQWRRYRDNWDGAKRNAVERGIHPTPHAPFGYRRKPDRVLEPDPDVADHVRTLFRLRAHGASWRDLCEHLEAHGLRPPRSERWTITSVRQVVRNRAYLVEAGWATTSTRLHTTRW